MPIIYLSPSTQEFNIYVTGQTEEYEMNKIADSMVPYLRSNGIGYVRNHPDMNVRDVIEASNEGQYDLHLALHSNAAPEGRFGQVRGSEQYYYPTSIKGKAFAETLAQNMKKIYPLPRLVKTIPTTSLIEVVQTKAPAVLSEIAYHDNEKDAIWIAENTEKIAETMVKSITSHFGLPFVQPQEMQVGKVKTTTEPLNIRGKPTTESEVLTTVSNGQKLAVWGTWNDWHIVSLNGITGYANKRYVTII